METKKLFGQQDAEQIAKWKEQYKQGIFALSNDTDIAYFKNPDRNIMNCAMSKASVEAALDMYEELAKLSFIGGSENMINDDQMFFGAVQQIKVKMEGQKTTLVNL